MLLQLTPFLLKGPSELFKKFLKVFSLNIPLIILLYKYTFNAVNDFQPTVYIPSTINSSVEIFHISSTRDENLISNISWYKLTPFPRKIPLVVIGGLDSEKRKSFSVRTKSYFRYEGAQTFRLGFKICFERGWLWYGDDVWVFFLLAFRNIFE